MSVRIMIAESQAVFRTGLRSFLERSPDLSVVGETENGVDAVSLTRSLGAGLLLLDAALRGPPNSEEITLGLLQAPRVNVLAFAANDDTRMAQDLIAVGARGCILRVATEAKLREAILAVDAGRIYIDEDLAAQGVYRPFMNTASQDDGVVQAMSITPREQDVCRLLAYGYTNVEVAKKLQISDRTVETHRAHIMTKMHLKSRADLVQFAIDRGLMKTP